MHGLCWRTQPQTCQVIILASTIVTRWSCLGKLAYYGYGQSSSPAVASTRGSRRQPALEPTRGWKGSLAPPPSPSCVCCKTIEWRRKTVRELEWERVGLVHLFRCYCWRWRTPLCPGSSCRWDCFVLSWQLVRQCCNTPRPRALWGDCWLLWPPTPWISWVPYFRCYRRGRRKQHLVKSSLRRWWCCPVLAYQRLTFALDGLLDHQINKYSDITQAEDEIGYHQSCLVEFFVGFFDMFFEVFLCEVVYQGREIQLVSKCWQ